MIDLVISKAIDNCVSEEITNPVEIPRYIQGVIVTGRKLELINICEGEPDYLEETTNFIIVNQLIVQIFWKQLLMKLVQLRMKI